MKIALVSPYSLAAHGGVQSQVHGLSHWLRAQGHEVTVLGPRRPAEVRFNGSVAPIEAAPGSFVRVLSWLGAERPDVVHVHEPLVPVLGRQAAFAAAHLGLPAVATLHACLPDAWWVRMWRAVLGRPLRAFGRITAVSRFAAAGWPRHLTPELIGNGIDLAEFDTAAREPTARVTFLGRRDEPRKGFDVFVDAIRRLGRPDVEVVVIGPGTASADGMRFLGPVDNRRRGRMLAGTTCFVAPQTGGESFGIVLLEALASGAQVVASDLGAFRDLVGAHPDVAHLVPTGDPQAFADAIAAALDADSPALRARARAVAEPYDWSVVGPRYLDQYEAVLDAERVAGRVVGWSDSLSG